MKKMVVRQDLVDVVWRRGGDRRMSCPPIKRQFQLAIREPFTGMDMARAVFSNCKRYPLPKCRSEPWNNADDWQFIGSEIGEPKEQTFMFVQVGYQRDHAELVRALARHGSVPAGQWIVPFMEIFTPPTRQLSVAVADASWVDFNGERHYPQITQYAHGELSFADIREDDGGFHDEPLHGYDEDIAWLVEVKK